MAVVSAAPARFAIVGNGWRARFFHRIAAALPDRLACVGAVTRSQASASAAAAEHGTAGFASIAEMLRATAPDFVLVCIPRQAAPPAVTELVDAGVPVLLETPPAESADALEALWQRVGASGLVQVAEQYPRYPGHAARRAIVASGRIGTPSSVHVSSTHDYHAAAMMRALLGVGSTDAVVRTQVFTGALVDPIGRSGWTGDDTEHDAATQLATIDFGGAMGLYDFTSNQWHNPLRHRRVLVRGSRGEIDSDRVVWLAQQRTVRHGEITRRQIGYDLDLDGYATDHLAIGDDVLWRNPFPGVRFSHEEIAIGELLVGMAAFARDDGPGPYPLADGCHDAAIGLAIAASAARGGAEVRVPAGSWANHAG